MQEQNHALAQVDGGGGGHANNTLQEGWGGELRVDGGQRAGWGTGSSIELELQEGEAGSDPILVIVEYESHEQGKSNKNLMSALPTVNPKSKSIKDPIKRSKTNEFI